MKLMLPRSVLISPLWQIIRYGCASGHAPKVFVLNRECTIAKALATSGSCMSW